MTTGSRKPTSQTSSSKPANRPKPSSQKPAQKPTSKAQSRAIWVFLLIIGMLALYYMATGSDPFNLFTDEVAGSNPTVVAQENISGTADPHPAAAASTTSPTDRHWQVYFTDPAAINDPTQLSGSIPETLIERINAAQKSIHIAAFEFNLTPVAEALIAAHQRGVEVRWVTDDENGLDADGEKGRGQFKMLKKAGIKVIDDNRSPLMHNKFVVFDEQIVWTGSTNLTVNDNFRNNNNVIVFDSAEVAAIYEQEFAELWAGKFGPTSPSTARLQSTQVDGIPLKILFSAEDDVIDAIIPLVENAKTSIRFMAFSFTHDPLEQAMQQRAESGVEVTGIFETRASETEYSALPKLYCAGFPVRQDGNPGTFHHKVIVIDGETVITGSLNFSDNADQSNDENTIILTSPEVAGLYLQEFDRRWAEAVEPDEAVMNCR